MQNSREIYIGDREHEREDYREIERERESKKSPKNVENIIIIKNKKRAKSKIYIRKTT